MDQSIIHDKEQRKTTWRLDPPNRASVAAWSVWGYTGTRCWNTLPAWTYSPFLPTSTICTMTTKWTSMGPSCSVWENTPKEYFGQTKLPPPRKLLTVAVYGRKKRLEMGTGKSQITCITWKMDNPLKPLSQEMPTAATYLWMEPNSPGHPEGIFDAMGNIYKGSQGGTEPTHDPAEFPSMRDGVRACILLKPVASHKKAMFGKPYNLWPWNH